MKMLRRFLAAALAAACLCGAGLAEVLYDAGTGVLTVSFAGAEAGKSYAFLAARGTEDHYSLNAPDLLFVDQIRADADGKVSAAFVGRVSEACVFLLGGEFSSGDSPRVIGSFGPAIGEETRLDGAVALIGDEAFMGCGFSYVYLGDGVTQIGARAFSGCADMLYIRIPSSVTVIGEDAFAGCGRLTVGCAADSAAYLYAQTNGIRVELVP